MFEQFLTNAFLYSLSLTLLHFLWQGLLVATVLKSALLIIDKSKSRLRYALSGFAMLANLLLAITTFSLVFPDKSTVVTTNTAPIPLTSLVNELTQQNPLMSYQELLPSILAYALPYIALLWLIAITILASKLLVEIHNVNRLPKHAHLSPTVELLARFNALAKQINLTTPPRLLISLKVDVPMAIGWLKPVVLLPASMVTGLSSAQLEMLLLHELAHIRRYDYAVNFLQTLVELLFFFHPSVAWVAKQMRNEREYCSDDIAVQHCGDPIAYAHTLADTASLCAQRHSHTIPSMAMASSGGDLKERVQRLVDHHCAPSNNISKWLAAISIVLSISLIFSNQFINNHLISNSLPNQWQGNNQILTNNFLNEYQPSESSFANSSSEQLSQNDPSDNSIAQQLLKTDEINEQLDINTYYSTNDATSKEVINVSPLNLTSNHSVANTLPIKKLPEEDQALIAVTKNIGKLRPLAKGEPIDTSEKKQVPSARQPKKIVEPTKLSAKRTGNDNAIIKHGSDKVKAEVTSLPGQFKGLEVIKSTRTHTIELAEHFNKKTESDAIVKLAFQRADSHHHNSIMKNPYQQELKDLAAGNEQYISTTKLDNTYSKTSNINQLESKVIWHGAKQLKSVDPVYPSLAKRRGIEIDVKVRFTIDEHGQVKDIKFDRQNRVSYFKSAIRSAIRKWRFLPAKKNEQAIESQMSKIFSFSLQA